MELNKIYNKDCIEGLRGLPDNFIDCCVTSPPYFGLRDYGNIGQIGLEETPELYVKKMVEVFTEVRRVLKKEGTLWLNLGDSYASNGERANNNGNGKSTMGWPGQSKETLNKAAGLKMPATKHGLKPKDLIGIPWMVAFALRQSQEKNLIKDLADRAWVAGLVDGEGCITILRTKSSHCDSYSYPPIVQIRMCDIEAVKSFADLIGTTASEPETPPSRETQRDSFVAKATAEKARLLIADIYPHLRIKRKQAIVAFNHQLARNKTNYQARSAKAIEQEEFCKDLINKLNQRENVDIPSWMVEPFIEETPGFYLRQDLIWHKPNPMPESVTDRCTKAHEYIFLMSKSAKYFYDGDSIKDKAVSAGENRGGGLKYSDRTKNNGIGGSHNLDKYGITPEFANKRSVWTVTTKPYSDAHFATFPEDLIVDMIKAGCPEKGIVLDPFMGAGTTALVAAKLNRNFIGFELNAEYLKIAKKRLEKHLGFFNPAYAEPG